MRIPIIVLAGFVSLFLSGPNTQAQAPVEIIEVLPPGGKIRPSVPRLLGFTADPEIPQLVVRFNHPEGGIQRVRNRVMDGDREPKTLSAYGLFPLDAPDPSPAFSVTWFAAARSSNSVNFYADHRQAGSLNDDAYLAKKGEILSHEAFQKFRSSLVSGGFQNLSQVEGRRSDALDPRAPHVESYRETVITMGLSGGISYLTTSTYHRKPEDKRYTGLMGSAYSGKHAINREEVKTAFGDKNLAFKGYSMLGDPGTGNAVILGGLKYRKDKTKKHSHFYEHLILVFGNDGKIVGREKIDTQAPFSFTQVLPITGEKMAPTIYAVPYAVFIGSCPTKQGLSGENPPAKMVLVVDSKTGQVVARNRVDLPGARANLLQVDRHQNGEIRVLFAYRRGNRGGFSQVTIGTEGVVAQRDVAASDFPMAELTARGNVDWTDNYRTLRYYETRDRRLLTLNALRTVEEDPRTRKRIVRFKGYHLLVHNGSGELIGGIPLPHLADADKLGFQELTAGRMVLTYAKRIPQQDPIPQMIVCDSDGNLSRTEVVAAPGLRLTGTRPLLAPDHREVYFVAQNQEAQGIYLVKVGL